MEVSNQPKLRFHGVDIVNVNLNVFSNYDNKAEIDLKVEPKVFYPETSSTYFRIVMEVFIHCENFFDLNLLAVGNFEFDSQISDQELKKNFVNENAPAIMFPYVRAFVTTFTSNLGNVTGPLTIPTQFFQGDLPEINQDSLEEK